MCTVLRVRKLILAGWKAGAVVDDHVRRVCRYLCLILLRWLKRAACDGLQTQSPSQCTSLACFTVTSIARTLALLLWAIINVTFSDIILLEKTQYRLVRRLCMPEKDGAPRNTAFELVTKPWGRRAENTIEF